MTKNTNFNQIINNIINYPTLILSVKGDQLETISNKPNKSDNEEVTKYLINHKSEIQEAFNEEYLKGTNVIKFQNHINKVYGSSKIPNFLKEFTSNWTSILQEKKVDIKLLLPGTHDSGAYKVDFSKTPAFVKSVGQKIEYFFQKSFGCVIKNWTVNQEHSIFEQLENGARLFDLRLGKSKEGTLYLSHKFLTTRFDEAVNQFKEFMEKHPKEKVVINLKEDYDYRECLTSEDMENAKAQIKKFINISLNDIYEIWPEKSKISDVKTFIQEQKYGHNEYLSLNTTPDGLTILKSLITDSLIKRGKKIQNQIGDEAINILHERNALGVTVDSPTPRFMQKAICSNIDDVSTLGTDNHIG